MKEVQGFDQREPPKEPPVWEGGAEEKGEEKRQRPEEQRPQHSSTREQDGAFNIKHHPGKHAWYILQYTYKSVCYKFNI